MLTNKNTSQEPPMSPTSEDSSPETAASTQSTSLPATFPPTANDPSADLLGLPSRETILEMFGLRTNEVLHPRNPFQTNPPDLKVWAEKYSYFANVSQGADDGDTLEKDPNIRKRELEEGLCKAMLKEYFDLTVCLPADSPVPCVLLIVNRLLWIDDILSKNFGSKKSVRCLDIGTDASCMYSLIGAKVFKWNCVRTEVDNSNFELTVKNVRDNDLSSSIPVLKVDDTCVISGALTQLSNRHFDIVICHPSGVKNGRSPEQAPLVEAYHNYINQFIEESFELKTEIKLCFLNPPNQKGMSAVKRLLRSYNVRKSVCSYPRSCLRYGMAWSFDHKPNWVLQLPRKTQAVVPDINNTKSKPKPKPKPKLKVMKRFPEAPLRWYVPSNIRCLDVFDPGLLYEKVKLLCQGLLMRCEEEKTDGESVEKSLIITAFTNTWDQKKGPHRTAYAVRHTAVEESGIDVERNHSVEGRACEADAEPPVKRARADSQPDITDSEEHGSNGDVVQDDQTESPYLKARVVSRFADGRLAVEMEWIDGVDREQMNHLFQFVQTYLKYT